jgi:molybdate transport repressor ModE-like protein
MDVRQLKYFIAIVEKGSFAKASELLGIAQPSLGFQVQTLEDELNVQLLVRTARGVHVTGSGQQLFDRAKSLLQDFDNLKRDISNASDAPHRAYPVVPGSQYLVTSSWWLDGPCSVKCNRNGHRPKAAAPR